MERKIYNKLQSIEYIKKLNLNHFQEKLFKKNMNNDIINFLNDYPAEFYAIRDKIKFNSPKHRLKVPKDKVLNECKNMELFTINVSSYNYRNNQLLVGDVLIKSNDEIYLTVSNNGNYSVRDAENNPSYNLKTYIDDRKLKNIKGLNEIIDYIKTNKLEDIIVEFAVFNINLGINNEKVIIYELRTEY